MSFPKHPFSIADTESQPGGNLVERQSLKVIQLDHTPLRVRQQGEEFLHQKLHRVIVIPPLRRILRQVSHQDVPAAVAEHAGLERSEHLKAVRLEIPDIHSHTHLLHRAGETFLHQILSLVEDWRGLKGTTHQHGIQIVQILVRHCPCRLRRFIFGFVHFG